jgi:hypothetical protein
MVVEKVYLLIGKLLFVTTLTKLSLLICLSAGMFFFFFKDFFFSEGK